MGIFFISSPILNFLPQKQINPGCFLQQAWASMGGVGD